MQYYTASGSKKHSTIYFTVKTAFEADRIIKQGLHFGGRYHKVESYRRVGPDTICPTCCHWGHTTYGCVTPERVRCAICAESHLTIDHKCPISGCRSSRGKYCRSHGSYKCANCGGKHSAESTNCPDFKQAVAIARTGREEWREKERDYEIRRKMPEKDGDSESQCNSDTEEEIQEREKTGAQHPDDLEMEIIDSPRGSDSVENTTH